MSNETKNRKFVGVFADRQDVEALDRIAAEVDRDRSYLLRRAVRDLVNRHELDAPIVANRTHN